jgi:3-deoxy-D-arabino-heptulosonate 7-phosphate (DAHP) synthase class II
MKRMNFPGRREQRRNEATERQAAFDALSTQAKIDRLVARSVPLTNAGEMARLRKQLEAEKKKAEAAA